MRTEATLVFRSHSGSIFKWFAIRVTVDLESKGGSGPMMLVRTSITGWDMMDRNALSKIRHHRHLFESRILDAVPSSYSSSAHLILIVSQPRWSHTQRTPFMPRPRIGLEPGEKIGDRVRFADWRNVWLETGAQMGGASTRKPR
jgi:hypothetical protein